jgi:hypothetical protein
LYGELAYLFPLVTPVEDYREEAGYWRQALRAALGLGRHAVLELGVGGGHLLSHLSGEFQATAVDLSEQMLSLSRRLNPQVEHLVGDMRTVRLGRTFKAVLIHDAIMYMLNEDDLRAALTTAKVHLGPGGALIMAPDWFKETFPGTNVQHWINRRDGKELTTIEYSYDPDPADTITETRFLYIWQEGRELRVEQDCHVMGLFPLGTWLRLMEEAGFRVEVKRHPPRDGGYGDCLLAGVLEAGPG